MGSMCAKQEPAKQKVAKKVKDEDEEEIKAMFKEFDTDGSGFITKEELKEAITEMCDGEEIDDDEYDEILHDYLGDDADKDGKVSYEEFFKGCKKSLAEEDAEEKEE